MPLNKSILRDGDLDNTVEAIVACYDSRCRRVAKAGPNEPRMPRVLVAVAGRPGSGKSTVVDLIAKMVRDKLSQRPTPVSAEPSICGDVYGRHDRNKQGVEVCVMPMDGYHLYRRELDRLPDPKEAHKRRGAEWTFNPVKMCADLKAITTPGPDGFYVDVAVPSFDHAKGDPIEKDITIKATASVVIVEGNYVLYRGTKEWAAVCANFDLNIFLFCPKPVATERLCRRHMKAWNITRAEAMVRASGSDSTNGDLVDTTQKNADVVIHSNEVEPSKL